LVAYGLSGRSLPCVDLPSAIPISIGFETDHPVDDVEIALAGGGTVFVQCALRVGVGRADRKLRSTVDQWISAANGVQLNPDGDRLLLAVERSTTPLLDLAAALRRTRMAVTGLPSAGEHRALQVLSHICSDLGFADQESIHRFASVYAFSSAVAEEAISILAGGVVANADAAAHAWREMVSLVRELAAKRSGLSVSAWADELSRRGVEFAGSMSGTPAARLEAMRRAVHRYRQSLIVSAGMMDLRPLGAPLPQFDHDRKRIRPSVREEKEEPVPIPLPIAFRRLGRILLLGLPGGGKTTALVHLAAHLAETDESTLPILVRVGEWWRLCKSRSSLDALIELAIHDVPAEDKALLMEVFRQYSAEGRLMILLDGLDETRQETFQVSSKIDGLQRQVHPAVDFVLTTRDSGYSAARTLGFRSVTLQPVGDLEYTLRRIIEVASEYFSAEIPEPPVWARERVAWIGRQVDANPSLRETPLIQVLLAVLASDPSRSELPAGRAQVMSAVIDGVIERWEVRQKRAGEIRIGPFVDSAAVGVVRESFGQIGFALVARSQGSRCDLQFALSQWLSSRWGLAPGLAESTSSDILHFWDECGVFVSRGAEPAIEPRIPLFAELGAAA
jgi:hypothetical protein